MSSIAKSFPYLEYLQSNSYLKSPTYKKHLSRFFRTRSNPDALYKGYLVGIDSLDDVNPDMFSVMLDMDRRWPQLVPGFRSQIALVSESFTAAIEKSMSALDKDPASTKSYLSGKNFCGTILITETKGTVSYGLRFDAKGDLSDFSVLWLDRLGSIMAYVVPGMEFFSRGVLPDEDGDIAPEPVLLTGRDGIDEVGEELISAVRNYILFCHFADVDVRFVARPGSREARKLSDDKDAFVNDTRFSVRRLTANYYTTICRDESFPVRGHFRMQPFGTGSAERKLIFISPYMKKGSIVRPICSTAESSAKESRISRYHDPLARA